MIGWTPNGDGVDHLDFVVTPEDLECVKAKWRAVDGELTQALTPYEALVLEQELADQCYDSACPCMADVHAAQRRQRAKEQQDPALFDADTLAEWTDLGGEG